MVLVSSKAQINQLLNSTTDHILIGKRLRWRWKILGGQI